MSDYDKPSFFDRLKALFSRVSFASDDDSDELGTRAMNRARKQQRRRDEFVTKRELDVLRKVRRERDVPLPVRSKPNLVQPANGQGGMATSPGSAKEDTLRKINEIERMMSVDIKGNTKKEIDAQKEAQNRAFLPTQPMSATTQRPVVLSQARPPAGEPNSTPELTEAQRIANSFAKTDMMTRPTTRPGESSASRMGGAMSAATNSISTPGEGENFLNSMMMSSTKMMAMDVQELSDDPILEEASIHFANGEFADAESALKSAIAPDAAGYQNVESWRALLDFYRAVGDQPKFESLGLDFVSLFDTSAPNWFSLSGDAVTKPAVTAGPSAYACPAKMDAFVANQLLQFIEMRLIGGGVVALDFSKLKTLEQDACEGLNKALVSLNNTACKVSAVEPGRLTDNTAALTVANDSTVQANAWSVRLEWLRLMGNATEFETVALDFCVANEVSPPSWVASKADFSVRVPGTASSGSVTMDPNAWSLSPMSSTSQVAQADAESAAANNHAELAGEITAGNVVVTPEMASAAQQQHIVAIDCAKLKRIDFASAGNLLNWVLEQVGSGKQVQFIQTHRLIAAFFNVIGITAHARVSLRRD